MLQQQDAHAERPGTEGQGVADPDLPLVDPPSQLVIIPTSSHALTDPNNTPTQSVPSGSNQQSQTSRQNTAFPRCQIANMPPPDQPMSSHIAPTSIPYTTLPSATHTSSGHSQPDISPVYSTLSTLLRQSSNLRILSSFQAPNSNPSMICNVPSSLPLSISLSTLPPKVSLTHLVCPLSQI